MVMVLERSSRLPGSEKRGIDVDLMLVSTPLKFGVGMPGIENTEFGMMDCRSSFVADVAIIGDDVDVDVIIPPPE